MPLLDSTHYPSIRRAISLSLDAVTLPDSAIEDSQFVERAEEWVAAQTSDTGENARRAAINYTAYLLAPKIEGQLQAAYNLVAGGQGPRPNVRQIQESALAEAQRELDLIDGAEEIPLPDEPVTTAIRTTHVF